MGPRKRVKQTGREVWKGEGGGRVRSTEPVHLRGDVGDPTPPVTSSTVLRGGQGHHNVTGASLHVCVRAPLRAPSS